MSKTRRAKPCLTNAFSRFLQGPILQNLSFWTPQNLHSSFFIIHSSFNEEWRMKTEEWRNWQSEGPCTSRGQWASWWAIVPPDLVFHWFHKGSTFGGSIAIDESFTKWRMKNLNEEWRIPFFIHSSFFILHSSLNEEWRMKNEESGGVPILRLFEFWVPQKSSFSIGFIRFSDDWETRRGNLL